MADETTLETVQSTIKERNKRAASELSLLPNKPDDRGRNRFEQEQDRLERTRPSWENTKSPIKLGEEVLVPAGTPVGLGSIGAYVTGESIRGVLARTHSLRGGSGYMEHGHRTRNALSLITHLHKEGQIPTETIDLLVPNDMFEAVPQESTENSSNDQIAA